MSYILDGTTIKSPNSIDEKNSSQYAQNRTLDGTIRRDYFGLNKRIWTLEYTNIKKSDYDTINTIYQSYLSTSQTKTFQSTETNYSVSTTSVHINLDARAFSVGGEDYLSDITLTLTEA